jgi:hypothetical protein
MDEQTYKGTVDRLNEVNGVISKLDESIRADAWGILRPYVTGGQPVSPPSGGKRKGEKEESTPPPPTDATEEELIDRLESDKDHENLFLATAIAFKRHGRGPFAMKVIKDVAEKYKLSIPRRPDVTFGNSPRDGAEVARKQADGWRITTSGANWLKKTYGVTPGKDPLPS